MKTQSMKLPVHLALKAVAASALLAIPSQTNAAMIFEANFSGNGTGTGGASDVVNFGGTRHRPVAAES